jgi:copper chaperone CopZ
MKTSVIEVHDMLSVLSVDEVEKRIGEVMGVESVTVNYAAASATVRYDETRLKVGDVKSVVRQLGFESNTPASAIEDHMPPSSPSTTQEPAASNGTPDTSDSAAESAPINQPIPPEAASTLTSAAPEPTPPDTTPEGDEQPNKS